MKKTVLWICGALALVLLLTGAYFLYNSLSDDYTLSGPEETSGENKAPAPDFTVTDGDGNEVKLSDMKGKPVVVNFWASWCPPCKEEMPDFEEAYKKHGDEVVFMMVNMTDGVQETEKKAKEYIAETGYTFPVYFDTRMSAANSYRVTSIPATYFVDAEGNLATYAVGMISAANLEKGIEYIK